MGVLGKGAKNRTIRKYGQAALKHSRMGVHSLIYGAASLALLIACITIAFVMRGETYSFIGGLGILAMIGTGLGIRAGIKGLREREKRYFNCKMGIVINSLILFGLILIFLGGLM